jgi:peptide/nickel transport system substrate-binding protein
VTKYPYDLRRAEQLMGEAGLTRGSDGTYAVGGDRFSPELRAISGGTDEQELSALTDILRRAGINVQPLTVSPAQANDGQYVATFPAMNTANTGSSSDTPLVKLWTGRAPGPDNRWAGSALGGWSNPEYDRGYDAYNTTLDRAGRNNVVLNMMKLVAEELPVLPLYYIYQVEARTSSLVGPIQAGTASTWNVHEWQFK